MARIDGASLGLIAAGSLLAYAGVKGVSVTGALRSVITGKSPAGAPKANQIRDSGGSTAAAPAGSTGTVTAPATSSQKSWAAAQLAAVGALPTAANVNSLAAWANRESPWNSSPPDGAEYTHNPLNTTDQTGAIGEVNSVNVAIYPDWVTGIAATAATLQGYPDILARLRTGHGLCGWSSAEFSTWSGGGYDSVC